MPLTARHFMSLCFAAAVWIPLGAQAQTTEQVRLSEMQAALTKCGDAPETNVIGVCEASLSTILDMQPKLEYISEAVASYFIEATIRNIVSKPYFAQGNLNKHCENMEKIWLTRHNASRYSDHPIFPEISKLAMTKQKDVATCRQLGGTPAWGAPL